MTVISVRIVEQIDAPESATVVHNRAGEPIGFRLNRNTVVRPWIAYEVEENDSYRDLTKDELLEMGFDTDVTCTRSIEEDRHIQSCVTNHLDEKTVPVSITITEEVKAPAGAVVQLAPTGVVAGIRLKNGRLLRPWIVYECERDRRVRDLDYDEMTKLGFFVGLDYERQVTGPIEVVSHMDQAA